MKKSKLVNIILIMIISFAILLTAKETLAANNVIDITNTITSNGNNTVNNTVNNTANNTVNNRTNNVLTTNNTSNYNNSSLPKTGIEDSMPTVVLLVVLGISGVYAYKKMQDYKNI